MSTKSFISIIIGSLCLLFLSPCYAEIYKWIDEKGQVNYSDQPGNAEAEQVTIRKNETTTPRTIKKPDANSSNADNKNISEDPVKTEPAKISTKERRRLCSQAKSDMAAITSRGRMREINKEGEYIYLSEQQRQQRLSAARKKQSEFCR